MPSKRAGRGRVLAHHARAMALYPEPYFQKLAALLRQAGMPVVTDPHTGPLHARVRELLAAGIVVCLGQDDVSDAYYPFGRNNMLEVAFLASHLLWMTTEDDMERLYDMITVDAARAMGLDDLRIEVGASGGHGGAGCTVCAGSPTGASGAGACDTERKGVGGRYGRVVKSWCPQGTFG